MTMNNMPEISKSLVKPSVSDTPGNQPLEKNSQKNLLDHFKQVRSASVDFCSTLSAEDLLLQGAAFASPAKWHIAHTSWFFETFLLQPFASGYQCFDKNFAVMFNSYYNAIGEQHPRHQRGLLSRPAIDKIYQYRQFIDTAMINLLQKTQHKDYQEILQRTLLGLNHEQQHQELFFTDIKYNLSLNPLLPAYRDKSNLTTSKASATITENTELSFIDFAGGLIDIGITLGKSTGIDNNEPPIESFFFDNESPQHKSYIAPFKLSQRLVNNREFQAFIDDGGYQRPELWLADGWACVQENHWEKPIYWLDNDDEFSLSGAQPRVDNAPVCHISAYEADAYARWANARLPSEFEWEFAASHYLNQQQNQNAASINAVEINNAFAKSNLLEQSHLHPQAPPALETDTQKMQQLFGDCWEWTSSAYSPYPGFKAADNAIGEYNGKFMCNQLVLRGGSCVTAQSHIRASYRNFFYPPDRWQFSGIRLAKSV